jgi:predicted permease
MSLFHRLRKVTGRAAAEGELRRELAHHLEMETEAGLRRGLSRAEAEAAARRSFGGLAQIQEEVRDAWGVRLWDNLRQDLAYAFRGLRQSPGFAAIVVLTLALGIGANTAIFSVVHGVLLRPLPFAEPGRLVTLNQAAPKAGQPFLGFSVPDFTDFRARNRAFRGLAEYHSMWFILLGRAEPERVQTGVVSDNYFDLLGVKALHGRTFLPGEDKAGASAVLVLSHDYWMRSFGGDPDVVGRVFEMNNRPHTVVGVLPPLPAFPGPDQIFMPASACPFRGAASTINNRQGRIIANVIGRLNDGVHFNQAGDDTRRIGLELCGEFPADYPRDDGYTVETQALTEAFTGPSRQPLLVLLTTSGFVLLIACANVANLALARLARRERELAVRAAMGAGRGRILRQLLTESLLLSLLGGAAGLALAASGVRLLVVHAAGILPRVNEIGLHLPVLLFALAVSVATGLLFGSRVRLPRSDRLALALKDGSRGSERGRSRLRGLLVVAQVAISVPLLVGAGLSARSLLKLARVDPGLDTAHVLTANLNLNWTKYDDFPKRFGFWERAMQETARIPGVQSVGLSGVQPLNGLVNFATPFRLEGRDLAPGSPAPAATLIVSSEDYFSAVGQPLLRGRAFLSSDDRNAPPVAIINQSLASRLWPGGDPLGRRLTFDNGATWTTIVGVVANARQQLDTTPVDEIHIPLRRSGGLIGASIAARCAGDPAMLARDLREAIRRADPKQPVTSIVTLEETRDNALAPFRLTATLLGLFSTLALVITSAGIGSVLAFAVSQRTQEIGIRMALGASHAAVLRMVLRQGLRSVALGLVIGTVAALFLTRMMTSVLFEVPPTDPLTFVAVVVALLVVAVAACLLPARRATTINPIIALRAQ